MSQIIFRGVTIEEANSFCGNDGKRTFEVKCRAAWSEPVCKEMGWSYEPDGFGNGSLDGSLATVNVAMEPNGKLLKDFAFDITASKISKFRHIAKIEDGDTVSRQLEFVITTLDEEAHTVLNNWLVSVGPSDSTAQCKATFNAKVKDGTVEDKRQQTIPGTEVEPPAEEKPRGRKKEQVQ